MTRDDIIKQIDNMIIARLPDSYGVYDRRNYCEYKKAIFAEFDRLTAEVEALRNPWISVDKRIPVDGTWCLIYNMREIYMHRWFSRDCVVRTVTHWQPLPELPQ